ncbi:4-hydroxybenzoate polyprenyltransferase [Sulfurospirillum diekertiae]|uniref:4-hydroxybenzoate polyprenyltransferase n=1 Tax=Sulfurospirillum diekertiae TaxID=1854492 RepID=A0A6G9VT61_9BACT|nr:menaquinone biosynthesis prenyltransferase MqnP [Sulfurospirillum diekertiae]ASC92222.1 4-hydroxybenzoate octaprenyltransferase [Sulfurospirillum diekertiae]QIR76182.1 4-hydroxybenzoate polyprenyltransferase [Sulfurospirillum diekertiae]QIR78813.1 4-hydroxybenzoate polyprenyltransferase [Sulfurospirillum diekertiae]
MQQLWLKLKDISDLIVFKHSVFALPFIFVAMIVSSKAQSGTLWFGFKLLILGLLAAVSARNFAMAFNRYADRDIDKYNPRTASRPSVDGRIGSLNMQLFIALNAAIFIAVAYLINNLAFYLSVPILIILGGYSLFKRFSPYAHLVLGLSLGLAPIAGVVAIQESIPLWSILLSIGVMYWVAGFDLLYSLQDMEYDTANGLFSIPSRFGKEATFFISRLFHGQTILFWFLFALSANLGFFAYLGVLIAAIVLFFEHRIVLKDFSKIDRAFFTLNGYLGIIFFAFVFLDRI